MSTPSLNNPTIESAQQLLEAFSGIDNKLVESAEEKAQIGQALLLLTKLAESQNLGVCADTAAEGLLALESYLQALGYEVKINPADINSLIGSVYIKFNGQRQTYYLDSYTGKDRGVLVSCQSSEDESLNRIYGYLPLDLFFSVK